MYSYSHIHDAAVIYVTVIYVYRRLYLEEFYFCSTLKRNDVSVFFFEQNFTGCERWEYRPKTKINY